MAKALWQGPIPSRTGMRRWGQGQGPASYGWSRDSNVTSGQKGNSVLGVSSLPPACSFSLGRIINLKLEVWLLMLRLLRAHRTDVTVACELGKSRLAETSLAGSSPIDAGLPLDPFLSSGLSLTCYFAVQLECTELLLCVLLGSLSLQFTQRWTIWMCALSLTLSLALTQFVVLPVLIIL